MKTKIYVGNLSKSTTQDQIKTMFTKAGKVSSVELAQDKETGASKGFAYVMMSSQSDANQAIKMFHEYFMGDGMLKVNLA